MQSTQNQLALELIGYTQVHLYRVEIQDPPLRLFVEQTVLYQASPFP